jgi:predicted acetyltransferase
MQPSSSNIQLVTATIKDYQLIQNMARFYVYDLSRECGQTSSDWKLPEDGLYESFDFKHYLTEQFKKAFLVKVSEEIAGFVLINQEKEGVWNMGEFFIIARFQGKGIASIVAQKTWKLFPGKWQISVIPENKKAIAFWEKNIKDFTEDTFNKQIIEVTYDRHQPERMLFSFDSLIKK